MKICKLKRLEFECYMNRLPNEILFEIINVRLTDEYQAIFATQDGTMNTISDNCFLEQISIIAQVSSNFREQSRACVWTILRKAFRRLKRLQTDRDFCFGDHSRSASRCGRCTCRFDIDFGKQVMLYVLEKLRYLDYQRGRNDMDFGLGLPHGENLGRHCSDSQNNISLKPAS